MTSEIDLVQMSRIQKKVIKWFNSKGRQYPWRETSNFYEILIAEMMLRRTTATAVSRVFPEFLDRYPDFITLAAADLNDIEKMVQSLGLQSRRAAHLRTMASMIVEKYGNTPDAAKDHLEELPGVGKYVAAAVRNFSLGIPEPMVDGNIVHFLRRVFGIHLSGPLDETAWQLIGTLGGRKQKKQLYWGIIDIVALLCLRKNPRCSMCPMDDQCAFNASR